MNRFRTTIPADTFQLPNRINRLGELAYNLWWSWNPDVLRLYARIDADLWERVNHNPVLFLRKVNSLKLNEVASNRDYVDACERYFRLFDQYMNRTETWISEKLPDVSRRQIAYFSMEYGLSEALPFYAGGLGVLSGDHAKEASDLGLPFVAVGLFYREGYFTQRITEDGWQEARYNSQDPKDLAMLPVLDKAGNPVVISVKLPSREVKARIWEVRAGWTPIYLLDTNVEGNNDADCNLTARLYRADPETKITQEILLGMGGVRALRALGYNPDVWHMNEGHAAFMVLERIWEYIKAGYSFEEAGDAVRRSSVFTTHTPVPAGNDEWALWLMDKCFANFWPELGITRDQFMDLARHKLSWGDAFSMPVLALRFSNGRNGVSELHGQVTREMWKFIWPESKVEDVPIGHVTNGVHTGTWMARRLSHLYDRYLGVDWMERVDDPDTWKLIRRIPDEEIWTIRRHLKRRLSYFIRERARWLWLRGGLHPVQVIAAGILLDPYSLTIGFARRYAPYKRAELVLSDLPRLLNLINQADYPVQIIFAGKSHPDHEGGKLLIQQVYRAVKKAENGGRLVFLEDYDMNLARLLVQGVDVWMNTPRRPNEASGTSGQKAALNGVLNFSVLDGWWREGFNGQNGWAIGRDVDYADPKMQDELDADSLYDTLEKEIIPLYYQYRSSDNIPSQWVSRVKESIITLTPKFSTMRMVKEYTNDYYLPALQGERDPEPSGD
jgi:glycogen phosphorylase